MTILCNYTSTILFAITILFVGDSFNPSGWVVKMGQRWTCQLPGGRWCWHCRPSIWQWSWGWAGSCPRSACTSHADTLPHHQRSRCGTRIGLLECCTCKLAVLLLYNHYHFPLYASMANAADGFVGSTKGQPPWDNNDNGRRQVAIAGNPGIPFVPEETKPTQMLLP